MSWVLYGAILAALLNMFQIPSQPVIWLSVGASIAGGDSGTSFPGPSFGGKKNRKFYFSHGQSGAGKSEGSSSLSI